MFFVNFQIFDFSEKCFQNLIIGHNVVKAHKRNGILNTRVVRVKSDDIFNAHRFEFLQRYRAVKRLPGRTFVLSAPVKNRHYYIYTGGFSPNGGNNSFQILVMVVRAHRNASAVHIVFAAVISDVGNDKKIVASDSF